MDWKTIFTNAHLGWITKYLQLFLPHITKCAWKDLFFSTIAANVGKQIKYTGLAIDFTIPTIKKAYESLLLARIAKKVKSLSNA